MKIAILGTSGSGKSTLAKRLGERYGLPVLHMDTVHFLPGWVERPFAEEEAIVRQFLGGERRRLGHRRQLYKDLLCPAAGRSG